MRLPILALTCTTLLSVSDVARSQDAEVLDPTVPAKDLSALRRRQAPSRSLAWVGAGFAISGTAGLAAYTGGKLSETSSIDPGWSVGLDDYGGVYGVFAAPAGTLMLGSGALANAGVLRRGGVDVPNGLGIASLSLAAGTTVLVGAALATEADAPIYAATVTGLGSTVTGIAQLVVGKKRLRAGEEAAALGRPARPLGLAIAPRPGTRSPTLALAGAF